MDNDTSEDIGPRENALYLLAELERVFERGGLALSAREVAGFRERLARLMVRLAEVDGDADRSFSVARLAGNDGQLGSLSSVTEGSSPKINR